MPLTDKQQTAKTAILFRAAAGFDNLPLHTGKEKPALHGNHLGWVREALVGTVLEWPEGQAPRDDLRNALMETYWGEDIWKLYNSDLTGVPLGWKAWPAGGCRPPFWEREHERACDKLIGMARNPSYSMASVQAIPWLGVFWGGSDYGAPSTQSEWLENCRHVLHPEQLAALRADLGLPVEEPPPIEPEEPEEPEEPPVPEGLRAQLERVRDLLREADELEIAEGDKRNEARDVLLAALAALEG